VTKKIRATVGAVVAVLVILALAVPFFINVDQFRPRVQNQLSLALGRQVQIGKLSLSLLRGELGAANIAIADDPAFSNVPFVRARALHVGVEVMPLIFSRTVNVRSLTLTEPQVSLLRSANGRWNFSTVGQSAAQRSAPSKASANSPGSANPAVTVQQLKVENGRIAVGSAGKRPQTYEAVNLTAKNLSYTTSFPFTLEMKTPGGGALQMQGTAGPLDQQDASQTPFQAKVSLKQFDLAHSGIVDPSAGLGGLLDYSGTATSNGKRLQSAGEIRAERLRLVRNGSPASQPVTLAYASDYDLRSQAGRLTRGDLHTGRSTVGVNGTYDLRGVSPLLHLRVNGSNLPVEDLEGLLPAIGVVLPAGSSLKGGTLSTRLAADGPVDRLVTSGNMNLANARLAGFSLAAKLAALKAFAGGSAGGGAGAADTVIQTLASNLRVAPEGMRADNLQLVVPGIGTITGAGSVAGNNALNFKMIAKLSQAGAGGALSALSGLSRIGATQNGIPFLIQGTTSNPIFIPDVGGIVAGGLAGQLGQMGQKNANPAQPGLGGILGNILKKKP
jgi:AsmA protein